MKRNSLIKLIKWLKSAHRKPLVLRGARQVGKTWLVRELAKHSGLELVELNFEKQQRLATHFDSNDPKTILLNLQSALNQTIHPEKTILFLDEIQAAPTLFAKLRWFYETMPQLAVVAAGSLLEFVLEKHSFSMPVGRIEYGFIEPLGFEEFLLAKDETHLLTAIQSFELKNPFNEALHQKANQLFQEYCMVGGMPEAVSTWVQKTSLENIAAIHHHLLNTYQDDFAKYAGRLSLDYLTDVLTAIPRLLGKKTVYHHINPSARHASIKQAFNLLNKARLCHTVQSSYGNGIPIGAEINPKVFKTIFLDVGLVSTLLGLKLHQVKNIDDLILINQGALTEQVVGQLLRLLSPFYMEPKLYYWARESASASAEIDYLLQDNQQLIPIEVKSGSEGKLRSLHQFVAEKSWQTAVRFYAGHACRQPINTQTTQRKRIQYQLTSLPFYLIEQVERLI